MSVAFWIVIVFVAAFLALAIFCAGSVFGYNKGERDTLERADYFTRRDW